MVEKIGFYGVQNLIVSMEAWMVSFLLMMFAGLIGALSRQFVQWVRDKNWPGQGDTPLFGTWWCELFIGLICGWIAWELTNAPIEAVKAVLPDFIAELDKMSRLLAWALGFVGPDVLENLAQRIWPKPG
jgi:hypothetical protein